jgi:hypothetical protein
MGMDHAVSGALAFLAAAPLLHVRGPGLASGAGMAMAVNPPSTVACSNTTLTRLLNRI